MKQEKDSTKQEPQVGGEGVKPSKGLVLREGEVVVKNNKNTTGVRDEKR